MAMKAEDLPREALALTDGERAHADLAAELMASLEEPEDDPNVVRSEWAAEIERRDRTVIAGVRWATEPWETVRRQIVDEFAV